VSVPGTPARLVVVGASAGGLTALRTLVSTLPPDFEVPVVIVQHRARESELLCELVQECSALRVLEIVDKLDLTPGVFVAPPDYHVLLGDGHFSLSVDEPVRYSRPSIDVLFESVADAFGAGAVGVVLTGANADGSAGLRRIVDAGGQAVVEDPGTAEVAVMPRSAIRAVPEAVVLPVERIGPHLVALLGGAVAPVAARRA
jgi:two-component system, chemotaxis family, protein-glutamate methylesterase/glutaminase